MIILMPQIQKEKNESRILDKILESKFTTYHQGRYRHSGGAVVGDKGGGMYRIKLICIIIIPRLSMCICTYLGLSPGYYIGICSLYTSSVDYKNFPDFFPLDWTMNNSLASCSML